MLYYIYKIENIENNKKYIGLTNNVQRRRGRHFADLIANRHDNQFLQKEFNMYGLESFTFETIFKEDLKDFEIGEKEKYFIQFYDSYKNGYNQNEGGNFGASNGGTQLTHSDIYCIKSALEFTSRAGGELSRIYDVSLTTISRIKNGVNHLEAISEYESMSLKDRKDIYNNFCKETNFDKNRANSTALRTKRKLSEEQALMALANHEFRIIPKTHLAKMLNVNPYTLTTIENEKSYIDCSIKYKSMSETEKQYIVSLLSNK